MQHDKNALVKSSNTPVAIQLADGSSVVLSSQTQLHVVNDQPSEVELELVDGHANFDVTHVEGRSFTVRASAVLVHVIGTKFDVLSIGHSEGIEVQVSTDRGMVEVQRTDRIDSRRLRAGEHWTVWIPDESTAAGDGTWCCENIRELNGAIEGRLPPPATHIHKLAAQASHSLPSARTESESVKLRNGEQIGKGVEGHDSFARANVARRAGMMREAAAAYAEMLDQLPNDDPLAAIAAFELGRIRMDALNDPRGAILALDQALLVRDGANREDAVARLAICYDLLNESQACRKARQRYMTEYPAGVHTRVVAKLCSKNRPNQ